MSRWACLRESSMCSPNRCVCFPKPSFSSALQGAHGLKGSEGPHGPPGPAVSTILALIVSVSPHTSCLHLVELSSRQSCHPGVFHALT